MRQVPFRNGGLEVDDVAALVDDATRVVAFSGVQSATGHRSDIVAIGAIARAVGAIVFVDASQLIGALPVADYLPHVDVLAASDHKFLLNAGRGMGYCYLSPDAQRRFTPINAGWRAGREPMESFFGPTMDLSPTASRFDSSISWLAAIGNEVAIAVFDEFGADAIYARNLELTGLLRSTLVEIGWQPVDLPEQNRSTIVSIPLDGRDPDALLARLSEKGVVCSTARRQPPRHRPLLQPRGRHRPPGRSAEGSWAEPYFTAMMSIVLMSGSLASRSGPTAPRAAGICPLRWAWRPSSFAKVSKMPYVVSAELERVPGDGAVLLRGQRPTLSQEGRELVSLAGLGLQDREQSSVDSHLIAPRRVVELRR